MDIIDPNHEALQKALEEALADRERIRSNLEDAIERANVMAVQAEIANIELAQIINTSIDGMLLVDADFIIKRINNALLEHLHLDESDVIGSKCSDIMPNAWCDTDQCTLRRILAGTAKIELDIKRETKDGSETPFMFAATPFRGIDGSRIGMVARYKDITERKYAENMIKEANKRLEHLAAVDGLTQVANRRFFDQTLAREWNRLKRTQEPLSLILCDVDFFKRFNDTFGHQAGDDCLKAVALAIAQTVRRGGDQLARYGGEEFVVILPATDGEGALHVAEKIRLAVRNLDIAHTDSTVASCVTLSLGVATVIPSDDGSPEGLLKNADLSLYRAKSEGRDRSCPWPGP